MTELIDPKSIIILPNRQRKKITTEDLKPSIAKRGVIQPIIINRNLELVAGERRLTASKELELPLVPIRYVETLDPIELKIIELEENIKRKDLSWQDTVGGVRDIHDCYIAEAAGKGDEWSMTQTAEAIGVSLSLVSQYLRVFPELSNPQIASCTSASQAYNLLSRKDSRKIDDALSEIGELGNDLFTFAEQKEANLTQKTEGSSGAPGNPEGTSGISGEDASSDGGTINNEGIRAAVPVKIDPMEAVREAIQVASFLEWAPQYSGPKFNFIHCDFPYGIDVFAGKQSGRDRHVTYDDSPDIYWNLLECFCKHRNNFMAASMHGMFWFSMDYYEQTKEFFRVHAPEIVVQNFPLIWTKSDNVGIIPDAQRQPRRIYETAFILSREDRRIVKSVGNSYPAPTDKKYHHSTKPEPVLRHFMQMFVDESTTMLDPTCGSGSALRAAESLGARKVLGLEIDPENAENARTALRYFRSLRNAAKKGA